MIPTALDSMVGKRILLLSPHSDDVAFSIGGIVARLFKQADILLLTVFGRSGWALPRVLGSASVDEISAVRQQEDRAFCARHQIGHVFLTCPDSFVRGYDNAQELRVAPDDDRRTADIVRMIGEFVASLAPNLVIAPCGIGGHVDHRIVRTAAETLNQTGVLYYEDIPYSAGLSLAELDRKLTCEGLAPVMPVDIGGVLERKCEGMRGYRSQTSATTITEMLLHARRVSAGNANYAERLWRRAH
ncbi:PIG-L deacetylase family protein [Trinickia dinghuensis]|uniref:PIG-L family deacetylase n=1 Tax=Trinickia dinghuensis TaxID=2291023 RepID=A0A3D8JTC3_9BURK|nr:PIG-L family deacetylase [Trinickia dinghuensis]RDU96298.1 hypothetical protein DWV00_24685 [Trinickia dinghuensis]